MNLLKKPFEQRRFIGQTHHNNFFEDEIKNANSTFSFDQLVRSRINGYNSGAALWRNISCDRFLHLVKVPVMCLVAKDDPVTRFSVLPITDLKRNPNFIVAMSDVGGHCEFY